MDKKFLLKQITIAFIFILLATVFLNQYLGLKYKLEFLAKPCDVCIKTNPDYCAIQDWKEGKGLYPNPFGMNFSNLTVLPNNH